MFFTISYDNFYMSNEITTLEGIDSLIETHKQMHINGEYTVLFSCNELEEYLGYELIKVNDNQYTLRLDFNEVNSWVDAINITLHKCIEYR